jgi:hypothetical protein
MGPDKEKFFMELTLQEFAKLKQQGGRNCK